MFEEFLVVGEESILVYNPILKQLIPNLLQLKLKQFNILLLCRFIPLIKYLLQSIMLLLILIISLHNVLPLLNTITQDSDARLQLTQMKTYSFFKTIFKVRFFRLFQLCFYVSFLLFLLVLGVGGGVLC